MRKYVLALCLLFVLGVAGILIAVSGSGKVEPDAVIINDLVMSVDQAEDQTEANTIVTQRLTGLFKDMDAQRLGRDLVVRNTLLVVLTVVAAGIAVLLWGIHKRILTPFRKLDRFAQNVAAGNLEIPLSMDKEGSFGAFTESFDLMRVELARAREEARQANQSKKELVASLSHDIKTPVASIKAVSELMAATTEEEKELEQLRTISMKADQIDLLITNLFSATLEELQELPVTPKEVPSTILVELIQNADYRKRATVGDIPECLIIADSVRLAQVLDNVFENSYKYADTAIEVLLALEGEFLSLAITDRGAGVSQEELVLLCQKFYRGTNAKGKSGTGLGLYISRYFMEKMDGELHCVNGDGSFTVRLILKLA
jgi:signal transduction histidine kinase